MKSTRRPTRLVGGVIAMGALLLLAGMPAEAARSFGTQYVTDTDGEGFAAAYGTLRVQGATATNDSRIRAVDTNNRPAYTTSKFWNTRGTRLGVRSRETASSSFQNVRNSVGISGATAGPWYGAVKTCINVRFWFDVCSSESSGRV